MAAQIPEDLHRRALERVRQQYEVIAKMHSVKLERMNRGRPPSLQYRSLDELVREWSTAAGEVARFAVGLGLIAGDDELEIIRDFHRAHPGVWDEAQSSRQGR